MRPQTSIIRLGIPSKVRAKNSLMCHQRLTISRQGLISPWWTRDGLCILPCLLQRRYRRPRNPRLRATWSRHSREMERRWYTSRGAKASGPKGCRRTKKWSLHPRRRKDDLLLVIDRLCQAYIQRLARKSSRKTRRARTHPRIKLRKRATSSTTER